MIDSSLYIPLVYCDVHWSTQYHFWSIAPDPIKISCRSEAVVWSLFIAVLERLSCFEFQKCFLSQTHFVVALAEDVTEVFLKSDTFCCCPCRRLFRSVSQLRHFVVALAADFSEVCLKSDTFRCCPCRRLFRRVSQQTHFVRLFRSVSQQTHFVVALAEYFTTEI